MSGDGIAQSWVDLAGRGIDEDEFDSVEYESRPARNDGRAKAGGIWR